MFIMKQFSLKDLNIGQLNMKEAKDIVFSKETLREIHGKNTKISDWVNKKRIVEYDMEINNAPGPMKRFIVGNRINVYGIQNIKEDTDHNLYVENKLKLNCVGSRFLKINPSFSLTKRGNDIFFNANVNISVWAPPPINHLAESFMIIQAEKDILNYAQFILSRVQQ